MEKLNPNITVPVPKTIEIWKAAIDLVEYDEAREAARYADKEIQDLSQPADPVNLTVD